MDGLYEHCLEARPRTTAAAAPPTFGQTVLARILELLRVLTTMAERALSRMLTWQERRLGRQLLRAMSDRALQDIGLTRAEVLRETRKPFWRP
jgi:uncharacterized protein YjiS (DUF1127 family)